MEKVLLDPALRVTAGAGNHLSPADPSTLHRPHIIGHNAGTVLWKGNEYLGSVLCLKLVFVNTPTSCFNPQKGRDAWKKNLMTAGDRQKEGYRSNMVKLVGAVLADIYYPITSYH